jgi:hypothetical protein
VADLDDRADAQDQAALAVVARHALHDEELIAAYAAGGLDEDGGANGERDRARALVDRCPACRDLHRDVAAIGTALRLTATSAVAVAPRDFRLTVDDARRLGGPVAVRGVVTTVRRSIWSFARPLGATFASLGIVGLLLGSLNLGGAALGPMAADVASPGSGSELGAATPAPGASARSSGTEPVPTAEAVPPGSVSGFGNAGPTSGPTPATWLLGGSVALLVVGLVLIALGTRSRARASP